MKFMDKFMEKFNEIADRTLVPIASKVATQRHLSAIRDGMVVAIPLFWVVCV